MEGREGGTEGESIIRCHPWMHHDVGCADCSLPLSAVKLQCIG